MTLRLGSRLWCAALSGSLIAVLAAGCAREIGGAPEAPDGGDGGRASDLNNPDPNDRLDASFDDYTTTNPDAFFVADPPPPYCGPDDMHVVDVPTGSLACPSDKNREGCPCPEAGMTAACWPGTRLTRDHGICQDGMTRCIDTGEFGLRWSLCDGYVLPVEGATTGPEACGCFSAGKWAFSNLSPCIQRGEMGTWLYSSKLNDDGSLDCGSVRSEPPPLPDGIWSTSTLNVDCAGQFSLCFTIKAGDVKNPKDSDCVLMEVCRDVFYEEAGVDQAVPDLPAWRSLDTACASAFDTGGGYGEMSVLGESIECDAIDDGNGERYVFHRTRYCAPSCQQDMSMPGCAGCRSGGSGEF